MPYDAATGTITWRIHLASSRQSVFSALSTDTGRATFWAEAAVETAGDIVFQFPNGTRWSGRILENRAPELFSVDYFGDRVEFHLLDDGAGGTNLTLRDHGDPGPDRFETLAGWVSVLLSLKAAVDFGVDLRNHDAERTWDAGYADN